MYVRKVLDAVVPTSSAKIVCAVRILPLFANWQFWKGLRQRASGRLRECFGIVKNSVCFGLQARRSATDLLVGQLCFTFFRRAGTAG